jgi:hypothetical protein
MPARVEQRQHEGGELVAERKAREAHAGLPFACDRDRRSALAAVPLHPQAELGVERRDALQQGQQLAGRRAVVERCDEVHGPGDALQVRLQLALQARVEHGAPRLAQILPTRSSDGASVFCPGCHFAGQTSPSWLATYWDAWILRTSSLA